MDNEDLTLEQLFERAEKAASWTEAVERLTRVWIKMGGDKLAPDDPLVKRWRAIHQKRVKGQIKSL